MLSAAKRQPNFVSRSISLRAECSRLRAKRESLENILSHHTYTTESTKNLLAALENGRAGEFRPEGVLADFIEVDPAWERAAEEFLHDELEYVVVQDWTQAEQSMNLLRTELEGRATFLVEGGPVAAEPAISHGGSDQYPALPRLSDHLRFTNGLSGQTRNLLPRLSGCYLASDRDQARAMADAYPDRYFLLADGQCYSGRMLTGGRKNASGPLVLKREAPRICRAARRARIRSGREGDRTGSPAPAKLLRSKRSSNASASCSKRAKKKQSRSITIFAARPKRSNRANSRISVARLELDRLEREEERAHAAARRATRRWPSRKTPSAPNAKLALEALREQLDAAQSEAQQNFRRTRRPARESGGDRRTASR